jgi:pyruvate/2-oxoglutarate dehydrogenase complex dihydrolipoamide acyltransferase (E2) component
MAQFPIRVPKVSSAAFEATLSSCLAEEGESVSSGDPLYTVETDKAETEIPAAKTGIVHWTAVFGETYDVGTQIGYIDAEEDG